MGTIDIELIEELLQEQDLDCEDVFCSEGGCFQVTDIRSGMAHNTFIYPTRTSFSVDNSKVESDLEN